MRNQGVELDFSLPAQALSPATVRPGDLAKPPCTGQFRCSLSSMTDGAMKAANLSPHDFLCPWIAGIRRLIAKELMRCGPSLGPLADPAYFKEGSLGERIFEIETLCLISRTNITNLENYLEIHPTARTPAMSTTLKDLKFLQSVIGVYQGEVRTFSNRLVSSLALQESRKSIEQSKSTKHLTQLAYIFLPLSLSTSAFGMNTVELQNTRLWVFWATTSVLVLLSLTLWLLLSLTSNRDNRKNLREFGKAVIILFKFFWLAPSHGMTLIVFALCHSTIKTKLVLLHLGVWERIGDGVEPEPAETSLSSLVSNKTGWGRFWYRKVSAVKSFTASSQWYQRYFWQKEAP